VGVTIRISETVHDIEHVAIRTILLDRIARRVVEPRDGLGRVMAVVDACGLHDRSRVHVGDSHGLERLVGAYWNYDDLDDMSRVGARAHVDQARQELDDDVVRRAQEWMDGHA